MLKILKNHGVFAVLVGITTIIFFSFFALGPAGLQTVWRHRLWPRVKKKEIYINNLKYKR